MDAWATRTATVVKAKPPYAQGGYGFFSATAVGHFSKPCRAHRLPASSSATVQEVMTRPALRSVSTQDTSPHQDLNRLYCRL